ncbi:MAG: alpha/beta hydrolase [Pseudomonadota bacterium]
MARRWGIISLGMLFLAACADQQSQPHEPPAIMTWPDLTSRPLPAPTTTIRYRDGEAGVIDVWIPDGDGPHQVVVMIHGGCWQKSIADRTLMNYAADDLRRRGMAVWNIEYRGVDEEGGGYPGTFLDVAAAVDALGDADPTLGLNTDHVAAFGHSAGGHLAIWAASRENLPETSPLYRENPLRLTAVVNSGGLADLEASEPLTLPSCLADIAGQLTGAPSDTRPNPLSDTSPAELLPPDAHIISVNGSRDRIAPPVLGQDFTATIKAAGGEASYREIEGSGHVELIAPGTEAFDVQAQLLMDALGGEN